MRIFLGFLSIIFLALTPLAVAAAEPDMTLLKTPGGTGFGLWGAKPAKPAPTLFIFAGALEDMKKESIYTDVGRILAKRGFLYVGLDAPCHGGDVKPGEPAGLQGWRRRLEKGDGLVPSFVKQASDVLDYLIKEGYADENRIAACGTSRGGFLAYHFAAAEPRIKAVAGFSPVANLLALTEFAGLDKHEPTTRLALVHQADKLAGRAVWLSIGNNDQRVNTDDSIAFVRKVTAAAAAKQKDRTKPIPVELLVGAAVGHTIIAKAHELAAEWIAQQLNVPGK
jgi:dienelactone hydrolase